MERGSGKRREEDKCGKVPNFLLSQHDCAAPQWKGGNLEAVWRGVEFSKVESKWESVNLKRRGELAWQSSSDTMLGFAYEPCREGVSK